MRSDSTAALGAISKLRSSSVLVNKVVREISLDLSLGNYAVDALAHLPGSENDMADSLSRLLQPGSDAEIPRELLRIPRTKVPLRDDKFWVTAARGSSC